MKIVETFPHMILLLAEKKTANIFFNVKLTLKYYPGCILRVVWNFIGNYNHANKRKSFLLRS